MSNLILIAPSFVFAVAIICTLTCLVRMIQVLIIGMGHMRGEAEVSDLLIFVTGMSWAGFWYLSHMQV